MPHRGYRQNKKAHRTAKPRASFKTVTHESMMSCGKGSSRSLVVRCQGGASFVRCGPGPRRGLAMRSYLWSGAKAGASGLRLMVSPPRPRSGPPQPATRSTHDRTLSPTPCPRGLRHKSPHPPTPTLAPPVSADRGRVRMLASHLVAKHQALRRAGAGGGRFRPQFARHGVARASRSWVCTTWDIGNSSLGTWVTG